MPGIEHRRHDFCEGCPHEKRVSRMERDTPGGPITLVYTCEDYKRCAHLADWIKSKTEDSK